MSEGLSTGTVTFLFTDLEGSTRQWEQDPEAMGQAVATHDELLRDMVERNDGYLFSERGDGIGAAFWTVEDAVAAAVASQRSIREEAWPAPVEPACRMGVHTGVADERDGDYFGPPVNQAARICEAAHGGQVLISGTSADLFDGPQKLREMGSHRLPDLSDAVDLWQLVVEGDEGAYPPPRGVDPGKGDLPVFRTSLHGRESEIGEIGDQLDRWQIVTLCGPGGVGKTRLAVEVARTLRERYEQSLFVDLSSIEDADAVPGEVAATAGFPVDEGPEGQISKLVRSWRDRTVLLVLDNCEHLVDGVAWSVDRIAAGCPQVDVLSTSREALAVEGERVYQVRSLPLDAARELFLDRATAVRSDLRPAESDLERVQEICRHLDCLPLAVELAAARVAHLGLAQIATHLDDRFELLTSARRRSRQRRRTLEATVDWSYDLLEEPQRELLRAVGVFSGGFDLDAAAAVWGRDEMQTLDALASLVDKSLVTVHGQPDGSNRYGLLETIRVYAHRQLVEEDELERRHRSHAEHFLDVALEDPPRITDLPRWGEPRWGEPTPEVPDLDNHHAALRWFETHYELSSMGRLASRMAVFIAPGRFIDVPATYLERDDTVDALDDRAEEVLYLTASAINANYAGRYESQMRNAQAAFELAEDPATRGVAAFYLAVGYQVFKPDRVDDIVAEALEDLPEDATTTRVALDMCPAGALTVQGRLEEALEEQRRVIQTANDLFTMTTEAMILQHVLGYEGQVTDVPQPGADDVDLTIYGYRELLMRALEAATRASDDEAAAREAVDALMEARDEIAEYPARLFDRDVLLGCVALAYHRGEFRRSSELLAAMGPMQRSPAAYALYRHYRDPVKEHLDQDERQQIIDRGADLSTSEVLDEELERLAEIPEVGPPRTA